MRRGFPIAILCASLLAIHSCSSGAAEGWEQGFHQMMTVPEYPPSSAMRDLLLEIPSGAHDYREMLEIWSSLGAGALDEGLNLIRGKPEEFWLRNPDWALHLLIMSAHEGQRSVFFEMVSIGQYVCKPGKPPEGIGQIISQPDYYFLLLSQDDALSDSACPEFRRGRQGPLSW